jgi:glycerol-3-phosphate acyltransferase PlsX
VEREPKVAGDDRLTTADAPGPVSVGPVAVDAEGGDRAPAEILAGAAQAAERGRAVLVVGREDVVVPSGLPYLVASERIEMDEEPGQAVRRKKDSSLVRAAEAVRDGRAVAMVSAGNTGAAMASALLRMGRLPGVVRPAIATTLPVPGGSPTVLIDSGANAECTADMLVQFALMASVFSRLRFGLEAPRVGLLSIGEEPTKGNGLTKEAHRALAARDDLHFVGNVEGRDLLTDAADVVVTDGFTGNVALKALEGSLAVLVKAILATFERDEATRGAAQVLLPALAPLAEQLDPDAQGGAMLLGVGGVCVISHGSSSARAVANAIGIAHDLAAAGIVPQLASAIRPEGTSGSARRVPGSTGASVA